MDCFFVTNIVVYFADCTVPDSEEDTLGIDSTLFGYIINVLWIGTFRLDIAVGNTRPTPQLPAVIKVSDSNKPVAICLRRETLISSFDAVSTHRSQDLSTLLY